MPNIPLYMAHVEQSIYGRAVLFLTSQWAVIRKISYEALSSPRARINKIAPLSVRAHSLWPVAFGFMRAKSCDLSRELPKRFSTSYHLLRAPCRKIHFASRAGVQNLCLQGCYLVL
jgi:hypothetical protein